MSAEFSRILILVRDPAAAAALSSQLEDQFLPLVTDQHEEALRWIHTLPFYGIIFRWTGAPEDLRFLQEVYRTNARVRIWIVGVETLDTSTEVALHAISAYSGMLPQDESEWARWLQQVVRPASAALDTPRLLIKMPDGQTHEHILESKSITMGRRSDNDVQLLDSYVSRQHAEVTREGDGFVIRDLASKHGTFINGERIESKQLVAGDTIQIGGERGPEIRFLVGPDVSTRAMFVSGENPSTVLDFRHFAAVINGFRALSASNILEDILAMVIDSAVELTDAERGFILLASGSQLELKAGRTRNRKNITGEVTLSQKVSQQAYLTSQEILISDMLAEDDVHKHTSTLQLGLRTVLAIPLRVIQLQDIPSQTMELRRPLGVLYLDSREKTNLISKATRAALESLATEAALAIEHARLYRESQEKRRTDDELGVARQLQQLLLPQGTRNGEFFDATSVNVSCYAVGGDYFDYFELTPDRFGFTVGDVSGKGTSAALLTSMLQGAMAAYSLTAPSVRELMTQLNRYLSSRKLNNRFVTLFYGVLDRSGELCYSNAGHNPPFLLRKNGAIERLGEGGMVVGIMPEAEYSDACVQMVDGDTLVLFTDGVSEANNLLGEEFGEDRLLEILKPAKDLSCEDIVAQVVESLRVFVGGASQHDDITLSIIRYCSRKATLAATSSGSQSGA